MTNSLKVLIACFSWNGNTRYAAEQIQKQTAGEFFEIKPVTPYPVEYGACVDQARKEVNAGFKPELAARPENMDKYDVIFIGSPNWCGTIAPPVATFLTSCDLADKTIVPFFTHGGGGMQNCERDVRKLCSKANVLEAAAFSGVSIRQSDDRIAAWVKALDDFEK